MIRFNKYSAAISALILAIGAPALAHADGMMQSSADVDQIPGNIAIIRQSGVSDTAIIEQHAILGATYANAASIQQNGTSGSATVSQQGQQNAIGIAQYGIGDKVTATQNGTNLGVQINQYSSNSSIGVTQYGTNTQNVSPVTIKQY
jgi:hypothetical protein